MRRGRGRLAGDAAGAGPGGQCVCPECGATVEHETAKPCNERDCPECGTTMTRPDGDLQKSARALLVPPALLRLLKAAGAQLSLFDETQHQRHPAGSSKGGQFAPKGEGGQGSLFGSEEVGGQAEEASVEAEGKSGPVKRISSLEAGDRLLVNGAEEATVVEVDTSLNPHSARCEFDDGQQFTLHNKSFDEHDIEHVEGGAETAQDRHDEAGRVASGSTGDDERLRNNRLDVIRALAGLKRPSTARRIKDELGGLDDNALDEALRSLMANGRVEQGPGDTYRLADNGPRPEDKLYGAESGDEAGEATEPTQDVDLPDLVEYAVDLAGVSPEEHPPEDVWGRVDRVAKDEVNRWLEETGQPEADLDDEQERFGAVVRRMAGIGSAEGGEAGPDPEALVDELTTAVTQPDEEAQLAHVREHGEMPRYSRLFSSRGVLPEDQQWAQSLFDRMEDAGLVSREGDDVYPTDALLEALEDHPQRRDVGLFWYPLVDMAAGRGGEPNDDPRQRLDTSGRRSVDMEVLNALEQRPQTAEEITRQVFDSEAVHATENLLSELADEGRVAQDEEGRWHGTFPNARGAGGRLTNKAKRRVQNRQRMTKSGRVLVVFGGGTGG